MLDVSYVRFVTKVSAGNRTIYAAFAASNFMVSAAQEEQVVHDREPVSLRDLRRDSGRPDALTEIVLECADAAHAHYLVTGNQKHFPRFWKQTKIITTREFIGLAALQCEVQEATSTSTLPGVQRWTGI